MSNYVILGPVLSDGGPPSVIVTGGAPVVGDVIVALDSQTANWAPATTSGVAVTLNGNVTGASNANTVVKVDGVSYPASPSTNTVPVVTSSNNVTYQQIADAQVSSSAAIAGTKVSPAFGAQNVSTTGTLATGTVTLKSIILNDGYSGAITTDNAVYTIYTDTAMAASSTNDYVITAVGLDSADGLVYRADFSFTYQRISTAGQTAVVATAVPLNLRPVGAA